MSGSSRLFGRDVKAPIINRELTGHGECDCGNPAPRGICDRCAFLDGDNQATGRLISVMREQRYSTLADLAEALDMTPRAVLRVIAELKQAGRVASGIEDIQWRKPPGRGYHGCVTREHWEWSDVAIHFLVERRAA